MTPTPNRIKSFLKQATLLPLLTGVVYVCHSQTPPQQEAISKQEEPAGTSVVMWPSKEQPQAVDQDTSTVYKTGTLTKEPEFPGGIDALRKYVGLNFNVPDVNIDLKANIMISFIVEQDGTMSTFKIPRDPGYGLGDEAIRVLKKLDKKWIPGEQKGKKVRTHFTLPITVMLTAYSDPTPPAQPEKKN